MELIKYFHNVLQAHLAMVLKLISTCKLRRPSDYATCVVMKKMEVSHVTNQMAKKTVRSFQSLL